MPTLCLDAAAVRRALAIRDLTDPACGPHAMQLLLGDVVAALTTAWRCDARVHRASPIVAIADNYDRLRYPEGGAARDARYTRYVSPTHLLRTQTSAMIPPLLRAIAASPPRDVLLACPGVVYRRDAIDRLHTGEPHQLDLWRIARRPLVAADLEAMVARVVEALLPGAEPRCAPASHPYTQEGLQIDVRAGDAWIEIGECGLAHPGVLADAGLDPARASGLAMGLGLDRILMLRKGIDDIRILRSDDPRIAAQMADLAPYRPVSAMPPVRRDLSIAVGDDENAEDLGDRVREALGDKAASVEEVLVLSETPYALLPRAAAERLGIGAGQKNVLLRIVLRDLERTLTHAEANVLRDAIYGAVHRGTKHMWASAGARGGE
jgi:phenylalanyl-tRNA synthetase alpha chain